MVLSLMCTSESLNVEAVWTFGRPCPEVACVLLLSPVGRVGRDASVKVTFVAEKTVLVLLPAKGTDKVS